MLDCGLFGNKHYYIVVYYVNIISHCRNIVVYYDIMQSKIWSLINVSVFCLNKKA